MKKLFTAFAIILSLILIKPGFSDIGVILEGETEPVIIEENYMDEFESIRNTAKLVVNHSVSIVSLHGGKWGTCSGVIIKNTEEESIILTAKHCIGTVEELYVEYILADSVGISLYDDLAYIKLNEMIPDKTPAYISEFTPKRGDLVIAVGYPSMNLHVAVGEISIRTLDWQFAKIHIIPGCSGGGAYNEYGELIGIIWGAIGKDDEEDKKSEIGIFERLQDVVKFVKKHKLLE